MSIANVLTELGTAITGLFTTVFNALSGIFFTVSEAGVISVTPIGYIALLGLVLTVVYYAINFISKLFMKKR